MKQKLLFLMLLTLLPFVGIQAQETYDLYICGTQVTSGNANNVLGDGAFRYDAATQTLYLNGDASATNHVVESSLQQLTIDVTKNVTLSSLNGSTLLLNNDATLKGTGKLTLESEFSYGIEANYLFIENMSLDVTGGKDAIKCYNLQIDNSTVNAVQKEGDLTYCAINTSWLQFVNCGLAYAAYEVGNDIYSDEDSEQEGYEALSVRIEPCETYDLYIAQRQVTSKNAADVLGDGMFSYDAVENTLTISGNYGFDFFNHSVIDSNIDGLTIKVVGNSSLETKADALTLRKNTTITGSGPLYIGSFRQAGIWVTNDATLTIDDANLEVTGKRGICGTGSTNATLIIRNSTIEVPSENGNANEGAIYAFNGGITLVDCHINWPEGGYVKEGDIVDSEGNTAKEVFIELGGEYDLYICGTQVTSGNADNVLGDGVFSYNAETQTLTLSGDCTYDQNYSIIQNDGIDGLVINVANDSKLTTTRTGADVITLKANTTFKGDGKLTLTSARGDIATSTNTLSITIEDMDMEMSGNDCIWGGALTIRNSTVHATGSTASPFRCSGGITLDNCHVTLPEGGYVNGAQIVDSEGNAVMEVLIEPGEDENPVVLYDLIICGKRVTNRNACDVLGDGVFSYDADTKTLTVSGDASTDSQYVVYNKAIDGLTVDITKDVKFTSGGSGCIAFDKNTILKGSGKLTIEAKFGYALLVYQSNLDIEDMTIDATGREGIIGMQNATLHITSSDVHVNTTDSWNAAFSGFTSITLEGCEIIDPENGYVENGKIVDYEGNAVSEVTIGVVKYDLYVCGTQVTSNNAEDILGIGGFSYDAATKTLSVSRSLTIAFEAPMINNEGIDGLTINVTQDVTLKTDHIYVWPIRINANTTVTGKGKLTVMAKKQAGFIVRNRSTLTFDDVRVETEGEYGGVSGVETEHLVVRNAVLHAISTSTSSPAIRRFVSLTLDGTKITLPEGGQFRATGSVNSQMVVDANGNMAKEVIIEPVPEEGQLMICRKLVTDDNAYDVLEDGVFRFDASTNTLTINGDCTYDGTIIDSRLSDLTIVSEGESSLRSLEAETIKGYNLTFKNSYPTKVVSDNDAAIRLLFKMPTIPVQSMQNDLTENLRIDHCEMEIKGKNYGLYSDLSWEMIGEGVHQPHGYYDLYLWTYLTIVDSKLIVRGNEAAIYHFTEMNCYGYPVIKPSAGEYHTGYLGNTIDTTEFYYQDQTDPNNPKPATEVIIGDSTTAIHDIDANVDTNHSNAVRYNLSGQRVGNDYKGIVIEGGKKMLIK